MFSYAIVSITQNIPSTIHGLLASIGVNGAGHDGILSMIPHLPYILPLPPGKRLVRADKFSNLPRLALTY
jgi:hypothetical protein